MPGDTVVTRLRLNSQAGNPGIYYTFDTNIPDALTIPVKLTNFVMKSLIHCSGITNPNKKHFTLLHVAAATNTFAQTADI